MNLIDHNVTVTAAACRLQTSPDPALPFIQPVHSILIGHHKRENIITYSLHCKRISYIQLLND